MSRQESADAWHFEQRKHSRRQRLIGSWAYTLPVAELDDVHAFSPHIDLHVPLAAILAAQSEDGVQTRRPTSTGSVTYQALTIAMMGALRTWIHCGGVLRAQREDSRIVVDSRGDAFRGREGLRLCTGREEEATVSRFKLMLALSMEDPVGINNVAAFAGVVVGLSPEASEVIDEVAAFAGVALSVEASVVVNEVAALVKEGPIIWSEPPVVLETDGKEWPAMSIGVPPPERGQATGETQTKGAGGVRLVLTEAMGQEVKTEVPRVAEAGLYTGEDKGRLCALVHAQLVRAQHADTAPGADNDMSI
ncbi:predicted protein [Postia placenta Mad-698-R]|nr:predicted protein [Postia placenta Mad-698-R]